MNFSESYEVVTTDDFIEGNEYQVIESSERVANVNEDEEFNSTEEDTTSDNILKIHEERNEQSMFGVNIHEGNKTTLNQEEVSYQEAFIQESNPLDAWLAGIKETLTVSEHFSLLTGKLNLRIFRRRFQNS